MKKQLLVLAVLICSTMPVQSISNKRHITEAIEQAIVQEVVEKNQAQATPAPVLRTEVSEAVKERQKQVQSLAKFGRGRTLSSRRSISDRGGTCTGAPSGVHTATVLTFAVLARNHRPNCAASQLLPQRTI